MQTETGEKELEERYKMVYYRLLNKNGQYIKYAYFPEKNLEREAGIIVVDIAKGEINIERLAAEDFIITHSVEEQNSMRDSINSLHKEEGLPPLTEEEWPSSTSELKYAAYGSHAINNIIKKMDTDEIPTEGMEMWY